MDTYLYIRISSRQQQEGGGIDRQVANCRRYCHENSFQITDEMYDIAESAFTGKNIKNGEFGRFIKDVDVGLIKTPCRLVVDDLDRISRDEPLEALMTYKTLLDSGVQIIDVHDGKIYDKEIMKSDPTLLLSPFLKFMQSHAESSSKSNRVSGYFDKVRKKERLHEGISPKWLKKSPCGKKWRFNNNNKTTIEVIIELYLEGSELSNMLPVGTQMVAKILNRHGFATLGRSKNWSSSSVRKVLKNHALYGCYIPKHKGIYLDAIDDFYPAIITEEKYKLIQYKMEKNKCYQGIRRGIKDLSESNRNVFSSIMRCGICGSKMYFRQARADGKKYYYLVCDNRYYHKKLPEDVYLDEHGDAKKIDFRNQKGCLLDYLPYRENEIVILFSIFQNLRDIKGGADDIIKSKKTELESLESKLYHLEQEEIKFSESLGDIDMALLPQFSKKIKELAEDRKNTLERVEDIKGYLTNGEAGGYDLIKRMHSAIHFKEVSKDKLRSIIRDNISEIIVDNFSGAFAGWLIILEIPV